MFAKWNQFIKDSLKMSRDMAGEYANFLGNTHTMVLGIKIFLTGKEQLLIRKDLS